MPPSTGEPGTPGWQGVRHLTGPHAPPWYVRHAHVLVYVVMILFVVVDVAHTRGFRDEVSFAAGRALGQAKYIAELSHLLVIPGILLVLARYRVVRGVRQRVRLLDAVHSRGRWRAAGVTALLNAVYVLLLVGPARWAVTAAYTAYATQSDRFRAADDVVAEATARFVDRSTGLMLLAMVILVPLARIQDRARRWRGHAG